MTGHAWHRRPLKHYGDHPDYAGEVDHRDQRSRGDRMAAACEAWGVNYLKPCVPSATHIGPHGPRCIYCKGHVSAR